MFVDNLLSLGIQQLTGKRASDYHPKMENSTDVSSLCRLGYRTHTRFRRLPAYHVISESPVCLVDMVPGYYMSLISTHCWLAHTPG